MHREEEKNEAWQWGPLTLQAEYSMIRLSVWTIIILPCVHVWCNVGGRKDAMSSLGGVYIILKQLEMCAAGNTCTQHQNITLTL